MRIIAGRFSGRRLTGVTPEIRPTTDRLRESLFNALGQAVVGSRWLDAFAGSGAVGLEALSRGAAFVHFNDRDRKVVRFLEENLARCEVRQGVAVTTMDYYVLLRKLEAEPFSFVFLDPPYHYPRYDKLLTKLTESDLASERTFVILEIFKKTALDPDLYGWELLRRLKAGDSHLLVMRLLSAAG